MFCGGHGQYLQGSCRCESEWKGRECTIRVDECEVPDCNGNGICIEGNCKCRSGFKGELCELGKRLNNNQFCFDFTMLPKLIVLTSIVPDMVFAWKGRAYVKRAGLAPIAVCQTPNCINSFPTVPIMVCEQ